MAKKAKELSPIEVSRLSEMGCYSVGGVAGLNLQIQSVNSKSWILRTKVGIKRREFGLGAYPAVGLGEARQKARQLKETISKGIDPIEAKKHALATLKANQAKPTFRKCASDYINMKSVEWKNIKHVQQWTNTIETYANGIIGDLRVDEIGQELVMQVLEPIWKTKTETASRLRGRIESILDWAAARGYRSQKYNPARWKGQLEKLLPHIKKRERIEHHPALPFTKVNSVIKALDQSKSIGAKVLMLTILTAVRPNEARAATWDEFDLNEKVWTIPKTRMKSKREHRVPLSDKVVELLNSVEKTESPLVFSSRNNTVLSDVTISKVLRGIVAGVTVHGFRSTFRDWCSERTNFSGEVAEMALAHTIPNMVEASYRRGDLFEKRISLMQTWANYCYSEDKTATITHLKQA